MSTLGQPLTLWRGTALMLNIVIGAGLLVLPGLAVKEAGDYALTSWIVCAVIAAPLLYVFVILGRRYPNAGGVAHFAERAFGKPGYAAASMIFLGAVVFGLPSIALTGGYYAASQLDGSPHAYAAALIVFSGCMHFLPTGVTSRVTAALSVVIVALLVGVVWFGLRGVEQPFAVHRAITLPPLSEFHLVLAPFMMIFFAFTGWEVAASLSEEFQNPKRDFPRAMALSFAIALVLYGAMAYVAQRHDLSGAYEAPFGRILTLSVGEAAGSIVSVLAMLIIFANLSGAIWAVSRLVFSLSREGLLPTKLQMTRAGSPWFAAILTTLTFLSVVAMDWIGLFGLDYMLTLAGQNFFVLYGIMAAGLLLTAQTPLERGAAILVLALCFLLIAGQGATMLYPLILALLGIIINNTRNIRGGKPVKPSLGI